MPAKRDIQQEILTLLLSRKDPRYTDIRPSRVANDLYNYHLQMLVKRGLIEKDKSAYKFTETGLRLVTEERPLSPLGGELDRFKNNVLTIVLKSEGGKWYVLNQTRELQPFAEKEEIMGGAIKRGEQIEDAVRRKLAEETGLVAEKVEITGCVRRIIQTKNGEVLSDIWYYPSVVREWSGELQKKTLYGENKWVSLDRAIVNEQKRPDHIRALVRILQALKAQPEKTPLIGVIEEQFEN